jgi:hypothetical protein
MSRVFLLSPANCGGARARQVLSPKAKFALAEELRSARGARLGDVFAFISGLYFRGKVTYATRFASPPDPANEVVGCGVHVITANAGLRSSEIYVTTRALRAFASGDIDAANASYRRPLERSARALLAEIGPDCDVVLLGRLRFPTEFVGRGDMSRGGLLLRSARQGVELEYAPVAGAVLHGARPPKLPPIRWPARG